MTYGRWIGRGALLSFVVAAGVARAAPEISVTPAGGGLIDETPAIVAKGLEPGAQVSVKARLVDDLGVAWTSEALVYAGNDGAADLGAAASTGGTYQGIDAAGLFWSMMPVEPGQLDSYRREMPKHPERTAAPVFREPGTRELRIWVERDGRELAVTSYQQRRVAADVEIRPVEEGRLRGMLYRPKGGSGRKPALIWMTGSGGGIDSRYAPLLASHGYTVLALGYFGYRDLPKASANLPVEYFGEALDWMARETGQAKTVVVGMSRGTEAALLTGSYFPAKVAGVVAYVPSHVVNNGIDEKGDVTVANWTWQGKPIPFAQAPFPDTETWLKMGAEKPYKGTPIYLSAWNAPGADAYAMPVERIAAPILLISGTGDDLWPSAIGGDRIVERLKAKKFRYPYRHYRAPGAGHLFTPPNFVSSMSDWSYLRAIYVSTGGTPELNAAGSRQAWRELLGFLDQVGGAKR